MNTFKALLFSLATLIAAAFATITSAQADIYDYNSPGAYNRWQNTNGNYDTVRINDKGRDVADHALYNLFNDYFAGVQGIGANRYASGNDLWKERGVKQDTIFTVDSNRTVRMEAAYRVADFTHTIGAYQNKTTGDYSHGMNYGASDWSVSLGTYTTQLRGDTESKFQTLGRVIDMEGNTGEMRLLMRADGTFIRDGINSTSGWNKFSADDNLIHMLVFDVSDLMYEILSATRDNIDRDSFTAYMVAWEDMSKKGSGKYPDFDYQDFVGIYTNFGIKDYETPFKPEPPTPPNPPTGGGNVTPEPATMLIAGLGIAGLALVRRRRK